MSFCTFVYSLSTLLMFILLLSLSLSSYHYLLLIIPPVFVCLIHCHNYFCWLYLNIFFSAYFCVVFAVLHFTLSLYCIFQVILSKLKLRNLAFFASFSSEITIFYFLLVIYFFEGLHVYFYVSTFLCTLLQRHHFLIFWSSNSAVLTSVIWSFSLSYWLCWINYLS